MNYKDRIERSVPVFSDMVSRVTPFIRQTIIAGGSAGSHTVSAINKGDQLVSALHLDFTDASETGADITSEFILDTGQIVQNDGALDNTGGTDTTGGFILLLWIAFAE